MNKITENIFVGTEYDCFHARPGWAVVHACKYPCYMSAVGGDRNWPKTHPNYLFLISGENLYMNIIDPPKPLFKLELFLKFMEFTQERLAEGKNILIHCNQGESRAPSLALVFMAKHLRLIKGKSYYAARDEFMKIYPGYYPGQGIQMFLSEIWDKL